MNVTCPRDFTNSSEFAVLTSCSIPVTAYKVLRSIGATLGLLALIYGIILLVSRRRAIFDKSNYSIALIFLSFLQSPIMSLRPLLSLTLHLESHSSLIMAYIAHVSGASAALVIILGVYVQARLIEKSSMSKNSSFLANHKGAILVIIAVVQAIAFLIGPLVSYYAEIRYGIMFWSTVVLIDMTIIPFYVIMGLIIYMKVRTMQKKDFKSVSRQILIAAVVAGGVGLGTGVIGVYLAASDNYEWVFTELCWISNIFVNTFILTVMSRERVHKKGEPSSKWTTTTQEISV